MEYEYDLHIGDVAERWAKRDHGECTPELLETYCKHVSLLIETGRIKAKQVPFIMRINDFPLAINAGMEPVSYQDYKYIITRAELLRFEAAEHSTAADTLEHLTTGTTPPPADLTKILVARAAWELHKEFGKFPQYREVLIRLRQIATIEDQAGAIIKYVDLDAGVTIVGRDNPLTVKTVKNWLGFIKKKGSGSV